MNTIAHVILAENDVKTNITVGTHQPIKMIVIVSISRGVPLCELAEELGELQVVLPRPKHVHLKGCLQSRRAVTRIPEPVSTEVFTCH